MLEETYSGLTSTTNKPRYNHAIGRVGTGAGVDWTYVDHTPGAFEYTGYYSDIALQGDAFFTIQTPDGMRFTRSGNFMVNKEGYLITPEGYQVVGQGVSSGRNPGPIQVGSQEFYVDPFGQIFSASWIPQPISSRMSEWIN